MTDQYDQEHPETGSSNISQATDEWSEMLAKARLVNDGSEPVLHTAYRLVNEDVANGSHWSKCMNCGSPFKGSGEFCSNGCGAEFYEDMKSFRSWH
jgi:hypothetical protein